MPLGPGTRLGPYEIQSAIGAGGMGEVYRARDTKLGRDVAIKVLPPDFARDRDRVARFTREAQILASLNHPNIAGIHHVEEADGVSALVMELVEGDTLSDRIAHGAIPLGDAVPIARQIADALEAAHDRGIIHRDLKPANIKITPNGIVKVLDFGLAKLNDPSRRNDSGDPNVLSMSPTITSPAMMTGVGMLLGTAAYMSPEQAKGRAADKRSDIWAFGCVLYEMLAGRRAFDGEDVADTLSAVLRADPDWTKLPTATPASIHRLLSRCLQKDRNRRLADIADARIEIDDAVRLPQAPAREGARPRGRRLVAIAVGCTLASVAITAGVSRAVLRNTPPPMPHTVRFSITPPAAETLFRAGFDRDIAIAPDDSFIVYRSGTGQSLSGLVVRMLNRLDAQQLLNNTQTVSGSPFVSPDSRWVGFFALDGLKKIAVSGGPPITICRFTGVPRGASWAADDSIIFATSDQTTGLLRVPAGGGEPKPLTNADPAHLVDHVFPSALPDGRGVLYTVRKLLDPLNADNNEIAVLDLKSGQSKTLIRGGSHAEYAETGHLVYAAAGALMAVPFDISRLEVTGNPVPLVEQIEVKVTGTANFALSKNGTLVYLPGHAQAELPRSLVWVNRQGHEESIHAPPRAYTVPRLSPDGRRVALQIGDQENDIWIWDLMRHTLTRLTFDPAVETLPVWSPDGARIIFNSTRSGVQNLYWQTADGTGTVERLTTSANPQFPFSMTPDGRRVLLGEVSPSTLADVRQLPMAGEHKSEPVVQTSFSEYNPKISPDGRWLAYQSNESGQYQIYVRPFPNMDTGRWQLSAAGGTRPVWARNGRELFYLDSNNMLTAVPIQPNGSTLNAGNSVRLLDRAYYSEFNLGAYDVSLDGQRFLMIKEATSPNQQMPPTSINVVLNWQEELKRLVPTR